MHSSIVCKQESASWKLLVSPDFVVFACLGNIGRYLKGFSMILEFCENLCGSNTELAVCLSVSMIKELTFIDFRPFPATHKYYNFVLFI